MQSRYYHIAISYTVKKLYSVLLYVFCLMKSNYEWNILSMQAIYK